MLHRLCGPPSIPLSFNLATVLPRQDAKALAAPPKSSSPTASIHRLRRGLPGYLILFAPHAFAPQRQLRASEPPSPLVFFPISTNFTSTLGIPLTSPYSRSPVSKAVLRLSPGFHPRLNGPPTCALRPVIPNNASPLRITAAAGTELAGASSAGVITSPPKELYNPRPSSLTRHGWIRLAPIVQDSPTAASRRSLGRVSVPVWLIILSNQLWIVGLVGHYPTNYLIQRGPILCR